MPQLPGSTSSRPVFEEKPDVRFGTTFLSNKYRDYAVEGEALMDKVTGELFIKREGDGTVVSHTRDKIATSDIIHNLWFLMKNNPDFKLIRKADIEKSNFAICDVDMFSYFNGEADVARRDFKLDFTADKLLLQYITSSGVFISVNTRTNDRVISDLFNAYYNEVLKTTTTLSSDITQEKERFRKNFGKDLRVTYKVKCKNKTDSQYQTYDMEAYIKSNELSLLPIKTNLYNYDITEIEISSIDFVLYQKFALFKKAYETSTLADETEKDRIRNMSTTEFTNAFFTEVVSSYVYSDSKVVVNDIVIYSNVSLENKITASPYRDNKFVRMIYTENIDTINSYLNKISTSYQNQTIVYSGSRPDEAIWTRGSTWVEPVETILLKTLQVKANPHVTDKNTLEKMLSGNKSTIQHVNITTIDPDGGNILVTPK